ncbi:RagB/SusD family nutrient uptake outer membrane protein [Marinifilum flexuosum]|nr:RagB/SusD family nutrient uptake outer membrane protein [Marinifilum flexuosum]
MKILKNCLYILMAGISLTSCDDFLDVKPADKVIPETYEDYRKLQTGAHEVGLIDRSRSTIFTDETILDEWGAEAEEFQDYYLWKTVLGSKARALPYQQFFKVIFFENEIIAQAANMKEGSKEEIDQLVAEAYFMRAYMHFNLLNMYAKPYNKATASTDNGVPIVTEIDIEQAFPVSTVEEVYTQILSDVDSTLKYINIDEYGKGLNYRVSKIATYGIKSRMHLYRGEYLLAKNAALEALKINDQLVDLNMEDATMPYHYTSIENVFAAEQTFDNILNFNVKVSNELISKYNAKDLRLSKYYSSSWGSYSVNKGRVPTHKCSLRISELYLILAESEAQLNVDLAKAKEYLNTLKKNRLEADFYVIEESRINAMNQDDLIDEIADERFRELAFEGHRWYDLRRTTQQSITHNFGGETEVLKQGDPRYTISFPQEAIDNNPNLRD